MRAQEPEYSMHIYEMMARLGIEPGAGVLPRLSLRYATAQRRCDFIRKLVGLNFFSLDGPRSPRAGLAGRPEKYEYPPIQDSSRLSLVDGRAPDWPEAGQANRGACGRRRSSEGG